MQDITSDLFSTLLFKFSSLFLQPSNIFYSNFYLPFSRTYLDKSDPNVEDFKSALIKAALMKIIIDFVQVLNMASEFDFRWPNQVLLLSFHIHPNQS